MLSLLPETKPKIVIVEDMPAVLEMLADKFRREGFRVFTASNGEEGYNSIKKHSPDLIVSDIFMPVLDGFDMMRRVRQNEKIRHIPVAFLSIMSEQEHRQQIRSVGNVAAYIWKNGYSLNGIVSKVKHLLHRH